jgi:site-specific recombinase XerD
MRFDKGTLLNLISLLRYPRSLSDFPALIPGSDLLAPYLAETESYIRQAKAAHTVKAYRSDWADFEKFCQGREVASLPAAPATVAAYAAEAARRLKARTIERRLTAISQAHQMAGYANPTEDKLVRTVLAGIRRVKGTAQVGKEPLSPDLLRRMLGPVSSDLRATRDRALLLVGFAGAFRRSEVVGLRSEDLRLGPEGLTVTIPRSKTDQEGEGQTVGIPYGSHPESCPVRALGAWLEQSGITGGYLFPALGRWGREAGASPITDHQLARIIKRLARAAGLDPAVFSGHSLRSGLATSAAEGGAPSWNRPATALSSRSANTSAAAASSRTMPPPGAGCRACLRGARPFLALLGRGCSDSEIIDFYAR